MKLFVWGIVGVLLCGMFWFIYNMNGNIVSSVGACIGMWVIVGVTLNILGKRKLK